MNKHKYRQAERLFEAIGEVDERYLFEAAAYRPRKKRVANVYRWAIPLAACLLAAVLVAPLLLMNKSGEASEAPEGIGTVEQVPGDEWYGKPPASANPGESDEASGAAVSPLDSILLSTTGTLVNAAVGGDFEFDSSGTVKPPLSGEPGEGTDRVQELLNGTYYLAWQGADGLIYASRALSEYEVKTLLDLMKGAERPTDEGQIPKTAVKLWLVDGVGGQIASPYLPFTSGNIGQNVLFDYDPELMPSDALLSLIRDILS